MTGPDLWIIAGPNGAGKTTFVQQTLSDFGLSADAYINPDAVTLEYLKEQGIERWEDAPAQLLKETFIRAANDVEVLLLKRMEAGGTALIESVLSTDKYCKLVQRVRELGGTFRLVYVALSSSALSKERVRLRVFKGGHGVPEDKLDSRWQKSLELLPWFAWHASDFWLIDNSEALRFSSGMLMITGASQFVRLHGIPSVAMRPLVADFLSRFIALNGDGTWRLDLDERYVLPDS